MEEKSHRWRRGHTVCVVFCVFFVTPSKIKMQTSQNRKFSIWEMKEDKFTKSLAKNQVCAIIHKQDIWKNILPRSIQLCMETPYWCPFEGHKCGRRRPKETSVFEFSVVICMNSSLEKCITIKVISILTQRMFKIAKSQKISNVFNPHKSFLSCQLNATSHKNLEVQASSITERRTL